MIFLQHIPLPQMNTFSMTEPDQLQYDAPRGHYLQANPLPMSLARPDMDMLMQDTTPLTKDPPVLWPH
jgi:hypothetical protein